jgi:hypothetical protein
MFQRRSAVLPRVMKYYYMKPLRRLFNFYVSGWINR